MILDTAFLISVKAEEESALQLASELETIGVPTHIPMVVLQQLYVSVGAGTDSHGNARHYEALVATKPIVPLDENIARWAGTLEGQHAVSDEKPDLDPVDAVVAATGLVYNEPVVSNDRDFRFVEGLDVESY